MRPNQDTQKQYNDAFESCRNLRTQQTDRFEVLAAAAEAEDTCPYWITDLLADCEEVAR